MRKIGRRGRDNHIDLGAIDRRLQRGQLGGAVADRRQHFADMRICLEYLADTGSCRQPGIDHIGSRRDGRHIAGAIGHTAVGDGRPIFDDEHALSLHRRTIIELDRRRGAHDDGASS